MMFQGIWLMYAILVIGPNEIILKPVDVYFSRQECYTMKSYHEKRMLAPMLCTELKDV